MILWDNPKKGSVRVCETEEASCIAFLAGNGEDVSLQAVSHNLTS